MRKREKLTGNSFANCPQQEISVHPSVAHCDKPHSEFQFRRDVLWFQPVCGCCLWFVISPAPKLNSASPTGSTSPNQPHYSRDKTLFSKLQDRVLLGGGMGSELCFC
eukprot:354546-Amphidinium_carterae.1